MNKEFLNEFKDSKINSPKNRPESKQYNLVKEREAIIVPSIIKSSIIKDNNFTSKINKNSIDYTSKNNTNINRNSNTNTNTNNTIFQYENKHINNNNIINSLSLRPISININNYNIHNYNYYNHNSNIHNNASNNGNSNGKKFI